MRVLIACEESQAECIAFRDEGHEAYSCDLQECSGGHPEWHIQDDVRNHLHKNWDLMIAHPTCQYLTNAGVRWLDTDPGRWPQLFKAADFFVELLNADIPRIAIENPIIHGYARRLIGRDCDQIIHPHQHGHLESKAICLWLKNLQKLPSTTDLKWEMNQLPKSEAHKVHYMAPGPERDKLRSKSYPKIARQMARIWGSEVQADLFHGT